MNNSQFPHASHQQAGQEMLSLSVWTQWKGEAVVGYVMCPGLRDNTN